MTEPQNPSDGSDKKPEAGDSAGQGDSGASAPGGSSSDAQRPDFGSPFDYDATAEASLSQTPGASDSTPTGSGPGWDTYSGVGNGPGWGSTPTYPSPEDAYPAPGETEASGGPVYGAPDPTLGQQSFGQQSYGQQQYGQQYGQQQYGQPYGQPAPGFPPPGQHLYGQPGYSPALGGYGDPMAPYGRHPLTGEPYSDKSKLTAGLLELFLGSFGAGRFYLNQPGIAVGQIAATWLTCGLGAIWPLIDAILMLTGSVKDKDGRPLREN